VQRKFNEKDLQNLRAYKEDNMKQIDLGFLNRKQLNRIIKEVEQSSLDIIEIHILKVGRNISAILEFRSEIEKNRFDMRSGNLIKDLNKQSLLKAEIATKNDPRID